jgi:hypothetical protein
LPPTAAHWKFSVDGGLLVAPGSVEYVSGELEGDYNGNGIVDAADYTIWRDTLGSTTDLRADGDGNNMIGNGDYQAWKSNFGAGGGGAGSNAAVPEPCAILLLLIGFLGSPSTLWLRSVS